MRRFWKIVFAAFLIGLSALLYTVHYAVFRDAHHIFVYLLGDIAFVPIDVLLVVLILEHVLETQQKRQRLAKVNVVIDAFFSETGNPFLRLLDGVRRDTPALAEATRIAPDWTPRDFARARACWTATQPQVGQGDVDLAALRTFLVSRRPFLLSLLQNPTLLEHDAATDMLWSLSHLTEELIARKSLDRLSPADADHLAADVRRAYGRVGTCWVQHMEHLKKDYPYLYSLAVRTNPFHPEAHAEIP
ncbi:MAG: hypothetical protein ACM3L6_01455 [Deltaproteobacteria bacterium]